MEGILETLTRAEDMKRWVATEATKVQCDGSCIFTSPVYNILCFAGYPRNNSLTDIPIQAIFPRKTETELREALLREKVKSLRRSSNGVRGEGTSS